MNKPLIPLATLALAAAAQAHVVLPAGGAAAGSRYAAAFKVGHACKGAKATTALSVRLPAGFRFEAAQPREGWTLKAGPREVTWTAATPQAALPGTSPDSFVVTGKLTGQPGTLWFRALQTCDVGAADWSAIPDAKDPKPEYPAPHLDVLPPGVAALDVRDAWARTTVVGQTTSAIYARLVAPSGAKLIGATSPLGDISIHEMKMEGDLMRMRELPDGVDLPPGEAIAFAPNGMHLMLTGLKQPLTAGASVPVVLKAIDRDGRRGELALLVPVTQAPPAAGEMHHHGG
jgi:copper(I)-binding protein/uncharacterized protein YcnI